MITRCDILYKCLRNTLLTYLLMSCCDLRRVMLC